MKTAFTLLLTALLICIATACGESPYEGPSTSVCSTIVTYGGPRPQGGTVYSYTLSEQGSDRDVELWSTATFKEEIAAGTRLVLNYRYAEGLNYPESGQIELISATKAHTAKLTTVEQAPAQLAPIGVVSLARSGRYIDLWCRVALATGRTFSIELDADTEGTSNPTLYISTSIPADATESYVTNYAASFDVSEVWDNPATQTLTVKINNSTNPRYSTFRFSKL